MAILEKKKYENWNSKSLSSNGPAGLYAFQVECMACESSFGRSVDCSFQTTRYNFILSGINQKSSSLKADFERLMMSKKITKLHRRPRRAAAATTEDSLYFRVFAWNGSEMLQDKFK